jgi:hypothetical protein
MEKKASPVYLLTGLSELALPVTEDSFANRDVWDEAQYFDGFRNCGCRDRAGL